MSMALNFEPHSYYMGFAIKHNPDVHKPDITQYKWQAFMDDGNTYRIIEKQATTLKDLKQQIKAFWYVRNNVPY